MLFNVRGWHYPKKALSENILITHWIVVFQDEFPLYGSLVELSGCRIGEAVVNKDNASLVLSYLHQES